MTVDLSVDLSAFVNRHLELLGAGDANALVDNDYHEQALMILMIGDKPRVIRGKPALKDLFGVYLRDIYRGLVAMKKLEYTDDSICLEATIMTTGGESGVWDAILMKDGKIYRHFSGLK